MNDSSQPAPPSPSPGLPPLVPCLAALLFAGLADFLFWEQPWGASLGVFAGTTAAGLAVTGRPGPRAGAWLALLLASAWQSAVETNLPNWLCLALALAGVLGESHYLAWRPGWERLGRAIQGVRSAPRYWREFLTAWRGLPALRPESLAHSRQFLRRSVLALAPALLAVALFTGLLLLGNANFAHLLDLLVQFALRVLLGLSPLRLLCWLTWLMLGLSLFWTSRPSPAPLWQPPARWPRRDHSLARWQSLLLLAGVNLVFFTANTVDAVELWWRDLPAAGTSYSQAVHDGVQSLILAVLAAAGVLVAIFQQEDGVSASRWLRGLAIAWIVQNLALLASVALRLKLYVEAYQLSVLRVYVACFLLLVGAGFLLLGWHILRGFQLGRLILGNLASVGLLFFVLQFCDVGAAVARWNVAQWERHPRRELDLDYLIRLGPSAWPSLMVVARQRTDDALAARALSHLREVATQEAGRAPVDWRSAQWRREARRAELRDFSAE